MLGTRFFEELNPEGMMYIITEVNKCLSCYLVHAFAKGLSIWFCLSVCQEAKWFCTLCFSSSFLSNVVIICHFNTVNTGTVWVFANLTRVHRYSGVRVLFIPFCQLDSSCFHESFYCLHLQWDTTLILSACSTNDRTGAHTMTLHMYAK